MQDLFRDTRLAIRMLRRSPLFSITAVLALGLGIAANTAIFSLMDALLLRPPPGVQGPDELVAFERRQAGQLLGNMGYPDFRDYRAQLKSFSGVAAEAGARVSLSTPAGSQRAVAALVSGDYFAVLRTRPAAGRLLAASDEREGGPAVAVIAYPLWKRAFGGDLRALGSTVRVNGQAFTVVGVAPPELRGTYVQFEPNLWVPVTQQPAAMPRMQPGTLENRASGWIRIFGRLKTGTSLSAAQAEVTTIAARLAQAYPATNHTRTVTLVPGLGLASDDRAEMSRLLGLLLACVGMLQLIACANVANLLLARAAARRREVAVRVAMGASPGRLVRLFLTEGMLLAAGAGLLGMLLAPALARMAVAVNQDAYTLRGVDVQLDPRVLAFVLALTVISGLLFALAPARRAVRVDLTASLKDGSPGAGKSGWRLRGSLIAAQIALSVALLAGAGTGLATMRRALGASPVVKPEEVVLGSLDLDVQGYSPAKAQRFYQALLQQVRALPGVASASFGATVPPEEFFGRRSIFRAGEEPPAQDYPGREFELGLRVDTDVIAPGFLHTLGIPLLAGREFTGQDGPDAVRVGIVNESLARRLWPGKSALGERIAAPEFSGVARPPVTIVGVIKDAAVRSLAGGVTLQFYLPAAQEPAGRETLIVRSRAAAAGLSAALRDAVARLDPSVPLFNVRTMPEHIAASLWRQRIAAGLLGVFGALALGLASMGVYGVAAHSVSQRTREIGIRMAIGARGRQITALVIREGMAWAVAGAAAGLPAALMVTLVMQKGIPGVQPFDPWVLVSTPGLLAAVSLLAGYFPARRAARVDPMAALRSE
ncbi:MAG TPA: ABC transporter permease [Bryobacteraceae bacterium]|nr:ABC transporter permease [Bryobacteraceae bacterium]